MTETTPWARLAARHEWQGGNVGGIDWPNLPPRSMIRAWETKMSPAVFDANGWARRSDRRTYRQRLAGRLIVATGIVLWCAIVIVAVWGVTA